ASACLHAAVAAAIIDARPTVDEAQPTAAMRTDGDAAPAAARTGVVAVLTVTPVGMMSKSKVNTAISSRATQPPEGEEQTPCLFPPGAAARFGPHLPRRPFRGGRPRAPLMALSQPAAPVQTALHRAPPCCRPLQRAVAGAGHAASTAGGQGGRATK